MIKKSFFIVFFVIFINNVFAFEDLLTTDPLIKQDGFTQALPVAMIKNNEFIFNNALDGTIIKHDFIVQNNGDVLLQILNVKTGCGCSKANFDEQILPGKSGKIEIVIDTQGYGGKLFNEKIKVHTNDPNNNIIILHISGKVETFANINPDKIQFFGEAEQEYEANIVIIPNKNHSFKIIDTKLEKLENKISFFLIKKSDSYILNVKNNQKNPGSYWGKIILKTDSNIKSTISIYVVAKLS